MSQAGLVFAPTFSAGEITCIVIVLASESFCFPGDGNLYLRRRSLAIPSLSISVNFRSGPSTNMLLVICGSSNSPIHFPQTRLFCVVAKACVFGGEEHAKFLFFFLLRKHQDTPQRTEVDAHMRSSYGFVKRKI